MDTQLITLCQELIRRPSLSGQEEAVAQFLRRTMEELGFDRVEVDAYGSVMGAFRGSRPGPTVLMDGHIDTVDLSDPDAWTHDPFGGELQDGKIYGRGASDMKGSVAAMVATHSSTGSPSAIIVEMMRDVRVDRILAFTPLPSPSASTITVEFSSCSTMST